MILQYYDKQIIVALKKERIAGGHPPSQKFKGTARSSLLNYLATSSCLTVTLPPWINSTI